MEKDKDGNYDPVTVAAIRWGFDPDQDETLPEWIERQMAQLDKLRQKVDISPYGPKRQIRSCP